MTLTGVKGLINSSSNQDTKAVLGCFASSLQTKYANIQHKIGLCLTLILWVKLRHAQRMLMYKCLELISQSIKKSVTHLVSFHYGKNNVNLNNNKPVATVWT